MTRYLRKYPAECFMLCSMALYLALYGGYPLNFYYNAPHDDGLMLRAAQNITRFNWLGAYDFLTLSKGVSYPLWIAFLNVCNVALPLGNAMLYAFACLAVMCALKPLLPNGILRSLLLVFLLFNPTVLSPHMMRVYRDAIMSGLCLWVLAWVIGVYARVAQVQARGLRAVTPYLCIGAVALPAWWFCREDSFWILPFILCGLLLTAWVLFRDRKRHAKRTLRRFSLAVLAPFASLLLCGLLLAGINWKAYGRFLVNDYTSDDFQSAYGALTRIAPEAGHPRVPVSVDAREKAYAVSPAFAELQAQLDGGDLSGNAEFFKNISLKLDGTNDYQGGWFFWALRAAVAANGYYESPLTAEAYYRRLAQEINDACDQGLLPTRAGRRSSLSTPFDARYIAPTMKSTAQGFRKLITLEGVTVKPAVSVEFSYVHVAEYRAIERLLNTNFLLKADQYPMLVEGWVEQEGNAPLTFRVLDGKGGEMSLYGALGAMPENRFGLIMEDYSSKGTYTLQILSEGVVRLEMPLHGNEEAAAEGWSAQIDNLSAYGQVSTGEQDTGFDAYKVRVNQAILRPYQLLTPILAGIAALCFLLWLGLVVGEYIRKKQWHSVPLLWVTAGVLLLLLSRVVMLAYITESAFSAMTPLYFSSAYPLLFLGIGLSICGLAQYLLDFLRRRVKPAKG